MPPRDTSGGPSAARCFETSKKYDDHAEQCPSWEIVKKQHARRKQVNKPDTYTVTMCKQRAVSVCPTSERWAAEPSTCAQLFSPCCQWASPGWGPSQRPVTGRPAHSLTSGLRRRVGSFPFCFSFLFFLFRFTASLSVSLHLSLSLFFNSHSLLLPSPSILPRKGPRVAVARERDDEQLRKPSQLTL